MNETVANIIVVALLLCGISVGLVVGRRINQMAGLPVPDGSGPLRRKIVVTTLLIAVIWGVIWAEVGFSDPAALILPTIFSILTLVVVFRGMKRL